MEDKNQSKSNRSISYRDLSDFWKRLTTGSVNRKIFGAAFTVAVFTTVVKAVSFVKELFIAWKFGTSDELDAFLIALVVPNLLMSVIGSSLASAFIPTYISVKERQGQKASQKLFSGFMTYSLFIIGITTILMVVTAPIYLSLIGSGFSQEKLDLTFNLLCSISPFVLLSGIVYVWEAVLNSYEKFAIAALVPIFIPVITIILFLSTNSWGIYILPLVLFVGTFIQIIVFGKYLRKQGVLLLPKWYGFSKELRQVNRQYLPMVAGAFLLCSAIPVDQAMAAMLSPGSVASLNYGNRIIAAPMSLITTALTAAIMPYCSRMFATGDWLGIRNTIRRYLQLITISTVPLALILFLFSQPIIELAFQRGSFTSKDTYLVAQIQSFYSLQIPFYIGNLLLIRILSSIQKNNVLLWASGFSLFLNIIFNYLFMSFIGIRGIALSTTCVYLFSFSYLFIFVNRYINKKHAVKYDFNKVKS